MQQIQSFLSRAWAWGQPQAQRFGGWYRTQTRRMQWIVGIVAVVGVLACCGGLSNLVSPSSSIGTAAASATATHAPTQVVSVATATPGAKGTATVKPTATISATAFGNATGGTETLGGTLDAFVADFGAPTPINMGDSFDPHCGDSGASCLMLLLFQGNDNLNHVGNITLQGATQGSAPWDMTTARAVCEHYFPADARLVQSVSVIQQGAEVGVDRVYVSTSLGHVFSAILFTDVNSNPTTPGTFDVQYQYVHPNDPSTIDNCNIALGSSQTQ